MRWAQKSRNVTDRFRIWGWKWQFGPAHEIVCWYKSHDLQLVSESGSWWRSQVTSQVTAFVKLIIFSPDRLFLESSNQDHLWSDSWECGLSCFFMLSAFWTNQKWDPSWSSQSWDWPKSANWDINLRFKIWSRDLISSSLILGTLTTNETPRFS